MFKKSIPTQQEIAPLLAERWSGRAYDAKRIVTQPQIISLLEAARWSPSCYGEQPWRYIICNQQSNQAAWEQALSCLAEGNQAWAKHAPLLILAVAANTFSHDDSENRWGIYDTGAATMSICLQATALGLMTHQMGGFNAEKATQLFTIPAQHTPMAMVSIGYQLAKDQIPEEVMQRESTPRTRNPLAKHCFDGRWDKPII